MTHSLNFWKIGTRKSAVTGWKGNANRARASSEMGCLEEA